MSLLLEPQEQFTIVRQLADHTDPTIYYVRATVRDAKSDSLIARVPLVNKGENRYSKPYEVPADPTGLGFYISIATEVFTDAGYTTKSNNYGDEIETYKIQHTSRGGSGGGGGASVDYKKIKDILVSEIETIKIPKPEKIDFSTIIKKLSTLQTKVEDIRFPEMPPVSPQTKVDLQPVLSLIKSSQNAVLEQIQGIKTLDESDIQPLTDAVNKIDTEMIERLTKNATADFLKITKGMEDFAENIPEFQKQIDALQKDFKDILYNMTVAGMSSRSFKKEKEEKEAPEQDYKMQRVLKRLSQ